MRGVWGKMGQEKKSQEKNRMYQRKGGPVNNPETEGKRNFHLVKEGTGRNT